MKRICILGSTGSIGKNVLQVVRHLKDKITVDAIAAYKNIDLLETQALEFNPKLIAVYDKKKALELQKRLPSYEVVGGMEGLIAVATYSSSQMVISALCGTLGILPTLQAIYVGKEIGLANKEVLVSAGELMMPLIKQKNLKLIPIDSEHSAIFQCLQAGEKEEVRRIILTSSGGPFRTWSREQLKKITVEDALNHPTWSMGPKITIDSSTLMNKGLEVIEAYWLFNIDLDKIEVVVHPQSLIHSLVEFRDFSMLAQMSEPSMLIPIQYALTYPQRILGVLKPFDFIKHSTLEFFPPDLETFTCLNLAYEAIREGGTLPCYMNAANEVLVELFLRGEISWCDIGFYLEKLMLLHVPQPVDSLEIILEVDALARQQALKCK